MPVIKTLFLYLKKMMGQTQGWLFIYMTLFTWQNQVSSVAKFDGLKTYCHNVYYQPGDVKFGLVEGIHRRGPDSSDICRGGR